METTYQLNFAEELKKCVKCGECRSNCPVFLEILGEPASPRGRLALVKQLQEGKIKPSAELADKLYLCLLCKTCAVNCPSGVITDEIVVAVREYLEQALGQSIVKRALLRGFLTRPALLQASFNLLKLYQKTGLRSVLTRTKLIERMPDPVSAGAKMLPQVTARPARGQIPEVTTAKGPTRFRVAYFLGCASNLIYPDIPLSSVKVLQEHGCEVTTPHFKCCGMPQLAYGDTETAVELARYNLELFQGLNVDAVVTDCASCSSTLSESYLRLFEPGTDEHQEAEKLSRKVFDISKFIIEKTGIVPGDRALDVSVTYHDPCHLKRAQKVWQQPRQLLKGIPGVRFTEMKEADRCCGSAGSFSFVHHELSMKILERKIKHVNESHTNIVATSCPTCTMQLSYGIRQKGLDVQVMHPVQLLAQTYGKE